MMKKRSLTDEVINEECKRSKRQQQQVIWKMYGDGAVWLRGAFISKGSVFIAKLKFSLTYDMYPSIMAVKSALYHLSGSIQKEKQVLDNLHGCLNVINCFGEEVSFSEDGQMVYNMLMEYGSGGSLTGLIKKSNGKGLGEYDVRLYTRSILRGLSHIHKKGYVHCDLNPDNVLLFVKGDGFIVKIGGLGSAKRAKDKKKSILGRYCTPRYLSPEGVEEQPGDIWAVGCIVFEMLTGRPFSCLNDDDDDVLSSVSEQGRRFLEKCLSKRVMTRLTANMLLKHSFLKNLVEDDEVEQVYDINAITSVASFSDDDSDDESSSSDESSDGLLSERDVAAMENKEISFHKMQQIPV